MTRRRAVLAALLTPVVGAAAVACTAVEPTDRPGRAQRDREPAGTARVVRIVDGDTVVLAGRGNLVNGPDTRVRLLEVDSPESVAPGQPVECWGPEATDRLTQLLPVGSRVTVRRDQDLLDPYGRTLLYLWNADGAFVNLELVRSGAAEAVLYEPNDRHIERLEEAEAEARRAGRGMWGACR